MTPNVIHSRVIIQVTEVQKMTMRWTQSRDLPLVVSVNEEIEALVIEAGESPSPSEKITCMENRTGNVVKVCNSANHPVRRSCISAIRNIIVKIKRTAPAQKSNIESSIDPSERQHFIFRKRDHLLDPTQWPTSWVGRRGVAEVWWKQIAITSAKCLGFGSTVIY